MTSHPHATGLRRQHVTCDQLLDDVLALLETGEYVGCDAVWDRVASTLEEHMRFEEEIVLPRLETTPEGAVTATRVRQEHAGFRKDLADMGLALELHELRLDTVRSFVERVRAHAAFENRALYPWADEGEEEQEPSREARTSTPSIAPRYDVGSFGRAHRAARGARL